MVKGYLEQLADKPSSKSLKIIFVSSIILLIIAIPLVINALEGSGYPGELERTQLGFDAYYIKECFSSMSKEEMTLFIKGNLVDYLFMVSYAGLFFSSALLLTRRFEEGSVVRKLGYIASITGVFAAISDGFENIFIISMAFDPSSFPDWLAITHSTFAHIKFNLMYITAGWIILALVYLVIIRVLKPSMVSSIELEINQ